jgi:hypothetical protein
MGWAGLGYRLVLGPLFWECPHPRAFTLHINNRQTFSLVIWNLCQVSKIFCSVTDFPRWKVGTAGFSFQALLSTVKDFSQKIQYDSANPLYLCIAVLALLYWQYRTRIVVWALQIWHGGRKGGKGPHTFNLGTWTIKKKTDQKSLSRRMAHSALLGFAIHCHQAAPQNREGPRELPWYSRSAYWSSRHFIRYQRPSSDLFSETTFRGSCKMYNIDLILFFEFAGTLLGTTFK